ncbi:MAG: hypothetical protein ACOC56_04850 [Atribacterota bacterium]
MKITVKKLSKGQYGIYKNGRKIDEESSYDKAQGAAKWYRNYYRGGVSTAQASKRYHKEFKEKHKRKSIFGFPKLGFPKKKEVKKNTKPSKRGIWELTGAV